MGTDNGVEPVKWTKANVIAAIQDFFLEYGRPPTSLDWNPWLVAKGPAREAAIERFNDDACWPKVRDVCGQGRAFQRWNDAIKAAGFEPWRPGIPKRRIPVT
jgi:hypothetical protein